MLDGMAAPKNEKAPKKAPAPKKEKAPRKPGRPNNAAKYTTKVGDMIDQLSLWLELAAMTTGNDRLGFDATVVKGQRDAVAEFMGEAAASNPKLRAVIDRAESAGSMVKVLTVFGGLVVPIAVNHGAVPRSALLIAGTKYAADLPDDPPPPPTLLHPPADPEAGPAPEVVADDPAAATGLPEA